MSVRKTIIHLISKETAIPVPITETTDLYKDLYLDSLSFVCLLMEVEKQYHITIELTEMTRCHIVGQLIDLVERKVKEAKHND